jgi:hypothetical protein
VSFYLRTFFAFSCTNWPSFAYRRYKKYDTNIDFVWTLKHNLDKKEYTLTDSNRSRLLIPLYVEHEEILLLPRQLREGNIVNLQWCIRYSYSLWGSIFSSKGRNVINDAERLALTPFVIPINLIIRPGKTSSIKQQFFEQLNHCLRKFKVFLSF